MRIQILADCGAVRHDYVVPDDMDEALIGRLACEITSCLCKANLAACTMCGKWYSMAAFISMKVYACVECQAKLPEKFPIGTRVSVPGKDEGSVVCILAAGVPTDPSTISLYYKENVPESLKHKSPFKRYIVNGRSAYFPTVVSVQLDGRILEETTDDT